jgi:hypothetical protein
MRQRPRRACSVERMIAGQAGLTSSVWLRFALVVHNHALHRHKVGGGGSLDPKSDNLARAGHSQTEPSASPMIY